VRQRVIEIGEIMTFVVIQLDICQEIGANPTSPEA
jgi:hypothetical protein